MSAVSVLVKGRRFGAVRFVAPSSAEFTQAPRELAGQIGRPIANEAQRGRTADREKERSSQLWPHKHTRSSSHHDQQASATSSSGREIKTQGLVRLFNQLADCSIFLKPEKRPDFVQSSQFNIDQDQTELKPNRTTTSFTICSLVFIYLYLFIASSELR